MLREKPDPGLLPRGEEHMPNLGAPELIIIAIVLVALFGWKRLPDMARSLGRSARVFKSEVDEMKKDGKPTASQSTASQSTVPGETVSTDNARLEAEARAAEAERKAAEARAELERLRAQKSETDIRRDTTL
jgi:sec-independent protein translocase protein TatA